METTDGHWDYTQHAIESTNLSDSESVVDNIQSNTTIQNQLLAAVLDEKLRDEVHIVHLSYKPDKSDQNKPQDKKSLKTAMDNALTELYTHILKAICQTIAANKDNTIRKVREKINNITNKNVRQQWHAFIDSFITKNYDDDRFGQCVMNVLHLLEIKIDRRYDARLTEENITLLRIEVLDEKLENPDPLHHRMWKDLEWKHFTKTIQKLEWDKQTDCSYWRCHKMCQYKETQISYKETRITNCDCRSSWQAWIKGTV